MVLPLLLQPSINDVPKERPKKTETHWRLPRFSTVDADQWISHKYHKFRNDCEHLLWTLPSSSKRRENWRRFFSMNFWALTSSPFGCGSTFCGCLSRGQKRALPRGGENKEEGRKIQASAKKWAPGWVNFIPRCCFLLLPVLACSILTTSSMPFR